MIREKRVPLAWTARWRRIRLHAIPVVCFALTVAASGWLWQRHGAAVHSIGQVDVLRIDVTSPTTGLVVALPRQTHGQWDLFDHVLAGDVIARFDDRPLRADKSVLRHETRQLVGQISEWQAESASQLDAEASEAVGRVLESERSRLAAIDELLSAEPPFVPADSLGPDPKAPELPAAVSAATSRALERFREARRGIELRRESLRLRAELLEVQAPISGTLVAVNCWPGQTVHEGAPIATIAADYGRHVVSYIPEDSRIAVKPGMRVTISSRVTGSRRIATEVEEVGRQFERIPARYVPSVTSPQWGIPVRIRMPSDAPLRPGALVDVAFHRES